MCQRDDSTVAQPEDVEAITINAIAQGGGGCNAVREDPRSQKQGQSRKHLEVESQVDLPLDGGQSEGNANLDEQGNRTCGHKDEQGNSEPETA